MHVLTLQGDWKIRSDPENRGRAEHWFAAPPEGARDAPVPGVIQQVFPDYHGVAWYWHAFQPKRPATHERCLLRFGAVDYLAEVWLNGSHVGGHEGGETPFTLDVTGAVRPDRNNLLAVRVLNPADESIDGICLAEIPHRNKEVRNYMPGRSYNYGGILLPVELLTVPAVRITDIFTRPEIATGKIRVTITVRNDEAASANGRLTVTVGPANSGEALETVTAEADFSSGETAHEVSLVIPQPRLWSLDDPHLYRVTVALEAAGEGSALYAHQHSVRCGFREFRVENGYFRLNGKRIFLRSTHTGNHFPIGQIVPHNPDFLRRDLLYAKALGFNTVRFIAGVAWPEQLDFCDEIGLMVYEESLAGWCLGDSPHMAERYDRSIGEMVLRDRNHPCVTIWGLLNETPDGPVFRHAVESLSLVRSLDDTRLVLLNSGRWDCQPGIGSLSNPGSAKWEHQWGIEAPEAAPASNAWDGSHGGYFDRAGDAHVYPATPHPPHTLSFLRSLGLDTKPVFLSEYGTGSLFNAVSEGRRYEQVCAETDLPDAARIRSMADKLQADWTRWGFDGVYPFVEDMLNDSQRLHVRQRLLGFDLVRSNPKICGFNVTGMLDHAITGEGLWTFWREFKPGIAEALRDGWAPLRWCLFVDPLHGYTGRPVKLEAVLANEDVLPPGGYPASFRVLGPKGIAWEGRTTISIPEAGPGKDAPLTSPALCQEVVLHGPPGEYVFAASLERGGCPAGGRLKFRLAASTELPRVKGPVTLWGIDDRTEAWLKERGIRCRQFGYAAPRKREAILVGDPKGARASRWRELARRMAQGSAVVFLNPQAFKQKDDSVRWLPLQNKGRCYDFGDWLYHKECVAKAHPIFDGLQDRGIMDWDYYDQVIPHTLFEGQDTPEEVVAAAFAVGYCCPGGYASGVLVASYTFGAGRFILNTLRVLDHLDQHPAADRLLLNFILEAQRNIGQPMTDLPADFEARLQEIGY